MSNVQLPLWAALSAAVVASLIGASGPILAQFVNSWRERNREEIRWQRDVKAESVRLAHDHAVRWREVKVRIYGDYLKSLRDFEHGLARLAIVRSAAECRELFGESRRQFSALSGKVSEIQLICSVEMLSFLRGCVRETDELRRTWPLFPEAPHESEELVRYERDINLRREFAGRYRKKFLEVAREELGVRTPKILEVEK
ncbi:hypothetical protein [Actinosynnema sp. NPDC020468]|uniref:hypothetical protein n=1 Tax=Actinosynnema sp. NPDC020468 TaxID=3154488 RepID=UPI0033C37860